MSIYTQIPYVPENTLDPAAGLNLSLRILRALTQTTVIDMGLTAPPGSPNDGDKYIVGAGATGDWAGMDDYLAEYVSEGDHWDFFAPGTLAKFVVNLADAWGYYFDPDAPGLGWQPLLTSAGSSSPSVARARVAVDTEDLPVSLVYWDGSDWVSLDGT